MEVKVVVYVDDTEVASKVVSYDGKDGEYQRYLTDHGDYVFHRVDRGWLSLASKILKGGKYEKGRLRS